MPNCTATWATTAATFHVDTYETTLGDTLVDCARLGDGANAAELSLPTFMVNKLCR